MDEALILIPVPLEHFEVVWPKAWEELEDAVADADGQWNEASLLLALLKKDAGLWVILEMPEAKPKMYLVTEFLQYPEQKVMNIWLGAGEDFASCLKCLPQLEAYAHRMGASAVQAVTRPGISKGLQGLGYGKKHEVVRKSLRS